jgi:hypothetical protein
MLPLNSARKDLFAMLMSNALVVIDTKHPDRNTLNEIIEAVKDAGGTILETDPDSHIIEVLIPTREIPIVAAMGGVSYVRQVFTYDKEEPMVGAEAMGGVEESS